jgi:nicotinate phosphoribosyltransferase
MIQRAYGLSTDLYQLTMAAAYFENRMFNQRATFEMFVRSLKKRAYLIAAGLEQAIDYLQTLRFTPDQLDFLREHPTFKNVSREFFDYLGELRFTGDVWAIPEGTAVFANEPLLRIDAPIIEAQLIETYLLATINFQTSIASKTARLVTAAGDRSIIEFGTRRAHGAEAGLMAARAAYIAGAIGTSNVEAGHLFGIPIFGTLAHSFVMSFDDEDDAFRAFLKVFPDTATILVDTYDTIACVKRLATEFDEIIPAIRLDSGDLLALSIEARKILDEAGKNETRILASGDLNEEIIVELINHGAMIDAFGVGTQIATSFDQPALGGVYKLVAIEANGKISMKIKLSTDKATYPGAKQVWRRLDVNQKYSGDVITFADEDISSDEAGNYQPLLVPVVQAGRALEPHFSIIDWQDAMKVGTSREARLNRLNRARDLARLELKRLPVDLLALNAQANYEVKISNRLLEERERLQIAVTR